MTERMKFAYNASDQIIPEWKLAYYDYQTIHKILQILETSAYYYSILHQRIALISGVQGRVLEYEYNISLIEEILTMMSKCSALFLKFHSCELRVIDMFAKMTYVQIRCRFHKQKEICSHIEEEQLEDSITILQNIYIEALLLKKMVAYNWKKQEQMSIRHENVVKRFIQIDSIPQNISQKRRLKKLIRLLIKEIQTFIKQQNIYKTEEQTKQNLKQLSDFKVRPSDAFPWYYFGLTCGLVMFSIILIIYFIQTHNINIKDSPFFANNFVIWRGASYLVLYMWVLGFGIKIMEWFTINYRLIFALDNSYVPTSKFTLIIAAFSTSVYVIWFAFYLLSLSEGYISEKQLNRFPGYFWAFLLGLLLFPIPIYLKSRIYFLKLLLFMIISPCYGVNFKIHWITQQFISFKQPIRDFLYTVNFYFVDPQTSYENSYLPGELIAISFLLLRIIQQIRQGCDKKYFGTTLPYATIKCSLGILTILMSIASHYTESDVALGFWVAVALVATLYTYRFDLKYDWGLLSEGSDGLFGNDRQERIPFLLNNRMSFKPYVYYIFFVLNFILRMAWVFTISTGIVEAFGIEKYVFTLIISSLEIIRRGVWNVFKIERQYLNKCEEFQAMIDYTDVERRVCERYLNRKFENREKSETASEFMSHTKIEKIRKTFQIATTRQYITQTEENQIQARKVIKQWELILQNLAPEINRYRVWG